MAVDDKGADPVMEISEEAPAVLAAEPVAARPRLSRTVTLGERTVEPIYAAPAPRQQQGAGGPNVVVNNTITVMGAPAVYGGYGGFGYGGSNGGGGRVDSNARNNGGSPPAWAASGWEGAGRTAAPGQTPHVGGNWAPAASHGPRQFK